jgi:hypothetical protein
MRKALSKSIESTVFDTIFAHNTTNTDFDLNLIDSHKVLSKVLTLFFYNYEHPKKGHLLILLSRLARDS